MSLKILPSLLNRHAELSKELDGINEVIDKEIVALAKKTLWARHFLGRGD